ncbi:MAG: 3-deoxy-8-phosphooctulonate synthase [Rickettsiales bacterium]|nr:3-deoxy-8-phosphooctulonate synthase [Rickettsiales bacterium]
MQKTITVSSLSISNTRPFTLIAGPCQMESRDHAMDVAEMLKDICARLSIPLIFKTSFDKANRSSLSAQRGMGMHKAMPVFEEIRKSLGLPVLTDVHSEEQCKVMAEVVDVLQIPAFLCRQTDLLVAAAKTGRAVNVKKGQFLAPWDAKNIVEKLEQSGCKNIMLTERGASFGYNTLVVDMRSLPIMAGFGYPVVFDATHAVQQPGGLGTASGGQREYVPVLAKAAVAVGVGALFMETHPNPDVAPSDGPCMMKLSDMEQTLSMLKAFDSLAKNAFPSP